MLPSQKHRQPSKNGYKSFMRNPFSSNRRASSSRHLGAHDPPPNTDVDVLCPTGPDHIDGPSVPCVTAALGQTSTTRRSLSLLWHGFEQLLKRVEPCLAGTPAKVPVNVLNTIIDIGKAVVENKNTLAERVTQAMDRLNVVNDALLQVEPDSVVESAMLKFAKKVIDESVMLNGMLNGMSSNQVWKKIIENEEDAKKIEESFKRLDEHTKNFQLEILLRIERNMSNLSEGVTLQQLENLPLAREALYNAAVGDSNTLARGACTPGTRVSILEYIYHWAQDPSSDSPRIFWLTGAAGSGKSTIAYTVAGHFGDKTKDVSQQILRATFFCSRQFEKTRRRENIIPTIVYQLARRSRSYVHALFGADKFSSAYILADQMKDLLEEPWQRSASKRSSELPPYLVVIDALDEIEGQGGCEFLQELLTTVDGGQLQGLKFLITSRPHPEVASLCATLSSDAVCRLYDVPMDTVKADILEYLKAKLPDLRDESRLANIAEKADGLFIYAATIVRYIKPRDRMAKCEQLSLMQKVFEPAWPVSSMASLVDKLYQQILQEAFAGLEKELFDTRLSILHTFLCTVERVSPLIASTLISGTGTEDIAGFIVSDLHAVLYVNEGCVFWYHASFPDFIFSKTRPKFTISGHNLDMACDIDAHNAILARRCFQVMMSKLRFNICNLPSSFLLDSEVPELNQLVQKNIDDVLKYCSRYWTRHLSQAAASDCDNLSTCIQDFLIIHVLFWIEAMNLLGLGLECNLMLQKVRDYVLKSDRCPTDLSRDIAEAASFATYFTGSPAALSTPHIYISSLATWSRNSTLSQMWKNEFSRIPTFTMIKNVENQALVIIPIGRLQIYCVALSTDGTRVASGELDKSVRVWDTSTGAELKTLKGHTDIVRSVAFSSDGTRIVSGSSDTSVRTWNALTGAELKTLKGHTDHVLSVAFSGNGTRIASGSSDRSLRVWDSSTGQELKKLSGHNGPVLNVTLSSDGTRIVSGSNNAWVWVWDALTGTQLMKLKGDNPVLSSDGTRIVSGSPDDSVQVWDALTGAELKKLDGNTGFVRSFAFSSDGTRIVSGLQDKSVRVWDASTGVELKKLNGHTGSVLSVAFSSDGNRVVSGSRDKSVRVWDILTHSNPTTPNVRIGSVESVAFSSDGTRIVSGLEDNSVRVWDALTGAELKKLDSHTGPVLSVIFSSGGTHIFSGSSDHSVLKWDALTGMELKKLSGHTLPVRSIALSSDDTRIVSGSLDNSVRVWDALTGAELKKLDSHTDCVWSVAFSSNDTRIISGSDDNSVRVWDALTGTELKKLNGHNSRVRSVVFSRSGTCIVSGSDDKSVRVWDALTGLELKMLNGHTGFVWSVALSSDGTRVVSGSADHSVRVWDLGDDNLCLLNSHNWIISPYGDDRLMWVPSDIDILHPLHNILTISDNGSATVDFTHSKIGAVWAECHTPSLGLLY